MIADAKLNGSISTGIAVAKYMIDPNAKQTNEQTNKLKGSGTERILLIQTEASPAILMNTPPETAAKKFMNTVVNWNNNHRPGRPKPKPHWEHRVISFHPDDKQKLNAQGAFTIARQALRMVASGNRPALYAVHGDTDHLHVHMLYSTVNETGKIHNPHADFRIWESAMETLEIEHNLHRVNKRLACSATDDSRRPDGTNPGTAEYRMTQRTGEKSCKEKLRNIIKTAITDCKSEPEDCRFFEFLNSLKKHRVSISANIQSTGRIAGIRLHYGIFSSSGIKASSLGRQFSWNQLSKAVGFDHNKTYNTGLLQLTDHRMSKWLHDEDNGMKWMRKTRRRFKSLTRTTTHNKPINSQGKRPLISASSSTSIFASPEFPIDYPEWLKQYIQALARAVNSEIASRKIADQKMHEFINNAINLFIEIQLLGIRNLTKRHFNKTHKIHKNINNTNTTPNFDR
ncbi:relaxase/mobilization nuclease domain-containing protein [uncultured Endozoicomonas sp.]|uniref:relaxase/mobilization nuclease domain-containing protein n=1 Tax=uncultured Endozoicomonas sp. TaxID=432652 RepID=UPI002619BA41|nr:relaxase/mobilization nuclease domain-containing protein [uncultured Endozoicomonas sp.]